ncbi:MAG: hypothetical protein V2B15_15375 [Bacteroidota bacterium]
MKRNISMISLLSGFAILLAGAFILSSCEGPAGPPGLDGVNGTDGIDGIDANATCTVCHSDDQVIVTKSRQYANSGHSTGDVSGYANRTFGPLYNCAGCHTSQGFLDNLVGASNTPYANVTQPNCYTCHNIHDTYTEADWGLTNAGIPEPATGSMGVDLGTGNQCASCHQMVASSLVIDSLWANFDAGTTTVTITAAMSRTGVHHGPQYNLLTGMDLFEFSGSTAYPTSHHVLGKVENGCVTCHMNDGFGDLTGHSMAMTWEFHGSETYNWPASCLECHSDGGIAENLNDKVEEVMEETDGLLDQLYTLLVDAGIMYPSDAGSSAYLMKPGVFSTSLTAAHVNYSAISEDRSHGFHNPAYIAAVLENTIEALSAK